MPNKKTMKNGKEDEVNESISSDEEEIGEQSEDDDDDDEEEGDQDNKSGNSAAKGNGFAGTNLAGAPGWESGDNSALFPGDTISMIPYHTPPPPQLFPNHPSLYCPRLPGDQGAWVLQQMLMNRIE